jgi:hypothetical protein
VWWGREIELTHRNRQELGNASDSRYRLEHTLRAEVTDNNQGAGMKTLGILTLALLVAAAGLAEASGAKQELVPTGIEPDASAHVIAVYSKQTDTTQIQVNAFGLTPGETYLFAGSFGVVAETTVGRSGTYQAHLQVDGDVTDGIFILGRRATFGFFVVLWNFTFPS